MFYKLLQQGIAGYSFTGTLLKRAISYVSLETRPETFRSDTHDITQAPRAGTERPRDAETRREACRVTHSRAGGEPGRWDERAWPAAAVCPLYPREGLSIAATSCSTNIPDGCQVNTPASTTGTHPALCSCIAERPRCTHSHTLTQVHTSLIPTGDYDSTPPSGDHRTIFFPPKQHRQMTFCFKLNAQNMYWADYFYVIFMNK